MNPLGWMYETTLVTMHKPPFITREDHAYHIQCFYEEKDETLSNDLSVDDLEVDSIENVAEPPDCAYYLRNETPNGPPMKYARIGQGAFHVWECETDSESQGLYTMKVHSCYVKSDTQDKHMIIDENG
ncbi:unnamed protein product [Soboliphyme baturini]|uniref:ZP domain-containing protein n=1 Tax=Soboliphyme baturini TaxID=241478 RepID=A0A183J4P8_9BILA|nr:unnamed protein product [Soboliphyme baturini]